MEIEDDAKKVHTFLFCKTLHLLILCPAVFGVGRTIFIKNQECSQNESIIVLHLLVCEGFPAQLHASQTQCFWVCGWNDPSKLPGVSAATVLGHLKDKGKEV